MADTASKPAAAATTTNNATNKPTKPDEEKYQEELAKAQKELKASQDKLVRRHQIFLLEPLEC